MSAQVQEKETDEYWTPGGVLLRPRRPTREQVRFAMDLCRSELPYAERIDTINGFHTLNVQTMSTLIDRLKTLRAERMARLRRSRRPRRR